MTKEQRDYLAQGLHQLGLNPDERALERLDRYLEALLAQNQVMNLTAITDPWEVIRLHFFDSAALLPTRAFPHKRVLDVGTGAGFPGLVLKILEPTISLTLLDSTKKRLDWLQRLCQEELEMPQAVEAFCHGRGEVLAREAAQREGYDVVVSRAVASMPVLAELCLPFVKVGGLFLAMKSNKTDQEIDAARDLIAKLGGQAPYVMDYKLPDTDIFHRLVTVQKQAPTPERYPRSWAKMKEGAAAPGR